MATRKQRNQGAAVEPTEKAVEAPETVNPDEETTQALPDAQEPSEPVAEPAADDAPEPETAGADEEFTEHAADSELALLLDKTRQRGYERVEYDGKLYVLAGARRVKKTDSNDYILDGGEWEEQDIEPNVQPTDEAKVHVTPELAESLKKDEPVVQSERVQRAQAAQAAYDSEWPKKVRTKMEPDREVEVFPKEYDSLKFDGLLLGE